MIPDEIRAKWQTASAGRREAIELATTLFRDYLMLMAHLRSASGCPWDQEQSLASLRQYVREEADEVCQAIDEILELEAQVRESAGLTPATPAPPTDGDKARTETKGLTIAHHPHRSDFDAAVSASGAPLPGNLTKEQASKLNALYGELSEELGDLLLQPLFLGDIIVGMGRPGLESSIALAIEKLIRRHPHVYGETEVADSAEVLANWEKIKKLEREAKE